jgi:hypothetical protein
MSIPPRVGGALVVLGNSNGTSERSPGHILTPPVYGSGIHHYFADYPSTAPSEVITKVWGLLGETVGPEVTVTPSTLPRNYLVIACYKTELNHYYPDAAKDALSNIATFNTQTALHYFEDESSVLNNGLYEGVKQSDLVDAWTTNFNDVVKASYAVHDDVTNILELNPLPPGIFLPPVIYPRWTAEAAYSHFGYQISDYFVITPEEGEPYVQTRTGESTTPKNEQDPLNYITPWHVKSYEGALHSVMPLQCDFSYKFTNTGAYNYDTHPTEFDIVYPWTYNQSLGSQLGRQVYLPDEATWTHFQNDYGDTSQPYPEGSYRCGDLSGIPYGFGSGLIKPDPDGAGSSFVKYENKATHGLFLDADGSCWNLGTTLLVKVHIWKAPPKRCFFANNETDNAYNGYAFSYTNFMRGLPTTYSEYEFTPTSYTTSTGLPGPLKGEGTISDPEKGWETGVPTQIDYTLPEPKPVDAHYWGCVFAPDFAHEDCQEVEVLDFTVVISESNTYECDGGARAGVNYTTYGVKLEDIELPTLEGFITYIKDFEVYSITKAGEV